MNLRPPGYEYMEKYTTRQTKQGNLCIFCISRRPFDDVYIKTTLVNIADFRKKEIAIQNPHQIPISQGNKTGNSFCKSSRQTTPSQNKSLKIPKSPQNAHQLKNRVQLTLAHSNVREGGTDLTISEKFSILILKNVNNSTI